jgi:drug/metabolite transporter (DMT)-like permease
VTAVSLVLVLLAAVFHAAWNFLAKRAGSGGPPFVWLFGALSSVLYAPLAAGVLVVTEPRFGGQHLLFLLGTGVLHTAYFLLLQRGYRVGELSLVYPLARGTGPLLSASAAVVFLHERPTLPGAVGGALICLGVLSLARAGSRGAGSVRAGLVYGLATGCLIATYTLWDKHAVSTLAIAPVVYDWSSNAVRTALLTPMALTRRDEIARVWRAHRLEVVGVAVMAPLAYILVLTALRVTQVSYVAPAREVSILFGTMLGTVALKEGSTRARLAGSALIVSGLVALAIA